MQADPHRTAQIQDRLTASRLTAILGMPAFVFGCGWAFGLAGIMLGMGAVLLLFPAMQAHAAAYLSLGMPLRWPGREGSGVE